MLDDPRGCISVADVFADTLLALIMAEQAYFMDFVKVSKECRLDHIDLDICWQELIAKANVGHQNRLSASFTALVGTTGGGYTRQQKNLFRVLLKNFIDELVALIADTALPIIVSVSTAPELNV